MRLFGRKKSDAAGDNLPPEVKEYYEAGKRERKGMAWLLALVTLLITVAIGFGAFFGGRWIYRELADNSGDSGTTQVEVAEEEAQNGQDDTETAPEAEPTPTPTPTPTPQPSTPSPSQDQTPVTGSSDSLAETGPGETIAAFVAATVIGTLLYQYRLRRKLY